MVWAPWSYDCVEALNATQRHDICPFMNVQMWRTFNKLFTFILVYLWTEAVSADSSPVSSAKRLLSAGAPGVMGKRKVRLFSLPITICSRRTRYEDDLGTSQPKVHTFMCADEFRWTRADIGRKSVSKNISWSGLCCRMRLTTEIGQSHRARTNWYIWWRGLGNEKLKPRSNCFCALQSL